MILFLGFFILICLLIAALLIFLFPKKERHKRFFIDKEIIPDEPWTLVEKGPDSTFTENKERG